MTIRVVGQDITIAKTCRYYAVPIGNFIPTEGPNLIYRIKTFFNKDNRFGNFKPSHRPSLWSRIKAPFQSAKAREEAEKAKEILKPIPKSIFIFDFSEEGYAQAELFAKGIGGNSPICAVILTADTTIVEGTEIATMDQKGKLTKPKKLPEGSKPLQSVTFTPGDKNVIILSYEDSHKIAASLAVKPLHQIGSQSTSQPVMKPKSDNEKAIAKTIVFPMAYPVSYHDLWRNDKAESNKEKIKRLFKDYAHPSFGWFLSGHWSRSAESIKFVDTILLPSLSTLKSEIADDPQALADWLATMIKQAKNTSGQPIEMNPVGSFMRRVKFVIETLVETANLSPSDHSFNEEVLAPRQQTLAVN